MNSLPALLILFAMSVAAPGALITMTNVTGPITTQSIVDDAGNPIADGYAAMGFIDERDIARLEAGRGAGLEVLASFTIFDGAEGSINNSPFPGTFSIHSEGVVPLNEPNIFSGNPIYLILSNGTDLASGTQLGLVRLGTFPSTEPVLETLIFNRDNVTVIRGNFDAVTAWAPDNPAFALFPPEQFYIPEPSSSLLLAIAVLAMLRRRR